jgi:hypothetical protein
MPTTAAQQRGCCCLDATASTTGGGRGLAALFLLLSLERKIRFRWLLLRIVEGTPRLTQTLYLVFFGVRDDGLSDVAAGLELRPSRLLFVLRLLIMDGDILAAQRDGTTSLQLVIAGADLRQLGFCCKTLGNVGHDLRLVAA